MKLHGRFLSLPLSGKFSFGESALGKVRMTNSSELRLAACQISDTVTGAEE